MPKYAIVEILSIKTEHPFENTDLEIIAFHLQHGNIKIRSSEFATAENALYTHHLWAQGDSPRTIICYETGVDNQYKILELISTSTNERYIFPQPITVPFKIPIWQAIPSSPTEVTQDNISQNILIRAKETEPTKSKINLEDSIELEKLKIAISELKIYGLKLKKVHEKGMNAIQLADALSNELNSFIEKGKNSKLSIHIYSDFKKSFNELLYSQDFSVHRAYYKVVIANIAIALTGVGALFVAGKLLHSYLTTNRVNGFFENTHGQNCVEEIDEKFENFFQNTPL